MRILISTLGSRGDVEPVAGLAAELKALGAEVLVCTAADAEFTQVIERGGARHIPTFEPMRQWVKTAQKGPPTDLPRRAVEVATAQFDAISAVADGCDLVLATGLLPTCAAAQAVAEQRGVPYVLGTFCPIWLPSEHWPPYAFPTHPHPPQITDNRALWDWDVGVRNELFGEAVNGVRAAAGLKPFTNIRDQVFCDPWLATDAVLAPFTSSLSHATQTGAWLLPDDRPLTDDLEAFLQSGPPPAYVGFGSMAMATSPDAARDAVAAVRAQGLRLVLAKGWADLASLEDAGDVFSSGDVNQQALFPRCAVIVHHGGAGTTTAASRSGTPQVVVPQIADQPYFARRVQTLGAGAAHDGPTPTYSSLSAALRKALTPEVAEAAKRLSGQVRTDGAAVAARMLIDRVKSA